MDITLGEEGRAGSVDKPSSREFSVLCEDGQQWSFHVRQGSCPFLGSVLPAWTFDGGSYLMDIHHIHSVDEKTEMCKGWINFSRLCIFK